MQFPPSSSPVPAITVDVSQLALEAINECHVGAAKVMFSMCVYMLGGKSDGGGGGIPIAGVLNVLLKVTVSCLCAVLSDAYMKEFKDQAVAVCGSLERFC